VSDFSLKYAMKKRAKKMCDGGKMMAEGGEVEDPYSELERESSPTGGPAEHDPDMKDADMIARIMHKRKMYSEGGMAANDDEPIADSMPAQFDDLALDDHLEQHDTGANSGDELGDAQEDDDRHDIVAKIMKSRGKKDRNPRPA
jgi:hypothetical protein